MSSETSSTSTTSTNTDKACVVAFTGKKGAGKDTATRLLQELMIFKWGERDVRKVVNHFAFADPLKEAAESIFMLSHRQLHDPIQKEMPDPRWNNKTPRELMQLLGTEVVRNIDPDTFCKNMRYRVENMMPDQFIFISDCRFENEAKLIRELGGKIVLITRDVPQSKRVKFGDHASEMGIPPELVDFTIANDDENTAGLRKELDNLFNKLLDQ